MKFRSEVRKQCAGRLGKEQRGNAGFTFRYPEIDKGYIVYRRKCERARSHEWVIYKHDLLDVGICV